MDSTALPLAAYIVATTFTPGPNNLSATSAGLKLGFTRALPHLAGIATGFFIVMLASGSFNFVLRNNIAQVSTWLKWIGFAYMLWLTASLFIGGGHGEGKAGVFTYAGGALLQLVNVKVILYGITLYGMFPASLLGTPAGIPLSALGLAGVASISILVWCLAGTTFRRLLSSERGRLVFNLVMAALLLWSAFAILLG